MVAEVGQLNHSNNKCYALDFIYIYIYVKYLVQALWYMKNYCVLSE